MTGTASEFLCHLETEFDSAIVFDSVTGSGCEIVSDSEFVFEFGSARLIESGLSFASDLGSAFD